MCSPTLTSAATIAAAPGLISQLVPLLQPAIDAAKGDATDEASGGLDQVLSHARCLIFDFDGAVRAPEGTPAAHINEALAAGRHSGRTTAVFARGPEANYWLHRHGLTDPAGPMFMLGDHDLVAGLAAFADAAGISLENSAVITATAGTVEVARQNGLAAIGVAPTPDVRLELASAGAATVLSSLADLTLGLRARPLPE